MGLLGKTLYLIGRYYLFSITFLGVGITDVFSDQQRSCNIGSVVEIDSRWFNTLARPFPLRQDQLKSINYLGLEEYYHDDIRIGPNGSIYTRGEAIEGTQRWWTGGGSHWEASESYLIDGWHYFVNHDECSIGSRIISPGTLAYGGKNLNFIIPSYKVKYEYVFEPVSFYTPNYTFTEFKDHIYSLRQDYRLERPTYFLQSKYLPHISLPYKRRASGSRDVLALVKNLREEIEIATDYGNTEKVDNLQLEIKELETKIYGENVYSFTNLKHRYYIFYSPTHQDVVVGMFSALESEKTSLLLKSWHITSNTVTVYQNGIIDIMLSIRLTTNHHGSI